MKKRKGNAPVLIINGTKSRCLESELTEEYRGAEKKSENDTHQHKRRGSEENPSLKICKFVIGLWVRFWSVLRLFPFNTRLNRMKEEWIC